MSDFNYPPDGSDLSVYTVPETTEGSSVIWVILFVIALIVIIGLVIWLVWSYRQHDKNCENANVIEFKDPVIDIASNTSLKATWTSPDNTTDEVTLYATLQPPVFNKDGTLSNPKAQSQKASPKTKSLTLTGLTSGIKYYATLVASNASNYQVFTQIVNMSHEPTAASDTLFAIEDIIQVGKIQLTPNTTLPNTQIEFNRFPTAENSLWNYNSAGQIESDSAAGVCIFNDGGILKADECSTTAIGIKNSKWTYSPPNYANQWCLTNTLKNDKPTCMILNPISTGSNNISTGETSAGDAWVNVSQLLTSI